MGTSSFSTSEENLLPKLFYIESRPYNLMDIHLGNVKIYRFKEPPYEFVMKYNKIFVSDDPNSIEYIQKVNTLIQTISHKNLAKIHSITIKQQAQMCIRNKIISTYVSYYTFTLQQVLMKRKSLGIGFSISELWYTALSLIQLGSYIQQFGVSYGCYHPNFITLSPQGYIKLYTHHISAKNAHALYYSAFDSRQNLGKFLPLPPQYLKSLQNSQCIRISEEIYSADIFNIGMTLLQMILHPQDSVKKYYLLSHNKIQFQDIELKKDIQSLLNIYLQEQQARKSDTFMTQSCEKSYLYSNNPDDSWIKLLVLITNIIESNPKKRWSFPEAKQYIQSVRDDIQISGCIKMFDQNQHSNHKKSFTEQLSLLKSRHSFCEQNNILKSIQINLAVTPIQRIQKQLNRQLNLSSSQNSYQTQRQFLSRKTQKNLSHGVGVSLLSKSMCKKQKTLKSSIDAKKKLSKPHQKIKITFPR